MIINVFVLFTADKKHLLYLNARARKLCTRWLGSCYWIDHVFTKILSVSDQSEEKSQKVAPYLADIIVQGKFLSSV